MEFVLAGHGPRERAERARPSQTRTTLLRPDSGVPVRGASRRYTSRLRLRRPCRRRLSSRSRRRSWTTVPRWNTRISRDVSTWPTRRREVRRPRRRAPRRRCWRGLGRCRARPGRRRCAKTPAADETAERYTALLRSLDGANTPAWQHYEAELRPGLRHALAARRAEVSHSRPGTMRACANRRAISGSRSQPRTAPLRWRRTGDAPVVRAHRVSRTPKRARGGWRPCATSRQPSAPSRPCVPNWTSEPADDERELDRG